MIASLAAVRRFRGHTRATAMIVTLFVCACSGSNESVSTSDSAPEDALCPPGSLVTWDNFAKGFFDQWCNSCHSENVTGDRRNGAPEGQNFDMLAGVLPHATRILARAASDPATMPPAGGQTLADRLLLSEWFACGAPGNEIADVPCANTTAVAGNLTIANPSDAQSFCDGDDKTLGGDLILAGDASVECLCAVGGDVKADARPMLTSIDLPSLRTIDGALSITDNQALTQVNVVNLDTVGAAVTVSSNSNLASIEFERLEFVGAAFSIEGNAKATLLDINALRTVGGDLAIEQNPRISNLDSAENVHTVGGQVRIINNDALTTLGFVNLENVSQGVEIAHNERLDTIDDFTLGFDGFSGDIWIHNNPHAQSVRGFDNIRSLSGSLIIEDNRSLAVISGFVNLASITHDLRIERHDALETVNGFADGLSVDGDLVLSDNVQWNGATTFAAGIDVAGQVTVE